MSFLKARIALKFAKKELKKRSVNLLEMINL